MTVPPVAQGRGAWTKTGKDNDSRYYTAVIGRPWDGSFPEKDVNYQAVSLGIKALQRRANEYVAWYGGRNPVKVDGNFSPIDREVIKYVQHRMGFIGRSVDGVVGPKTAQAMFRDLVIWYAAVNNVPAAHLWGMTYLESGGFDPGAVGFTTPSDRGLTQINLVAHPNISVEQAFDPHFALNYSAKRLADARRQFAGRPNLTDVCSIAQHNSPVAAKQWYEIGSVGADEKIAKYVDLVLAYAAAFK